MAFGLFFIGQKIIFLMTGFELKRHKASDSIERRLLKWFQVVVFFFDLKRKIGMKFITCWFTSRGMKFCRPSIEK